jgi:hypothetical protein
LERPNRNITEPWELHAFDWRIAKALALIIGVKTGVCKVTKRERTKKTTISLLLKEGMTNMNEKEKNKG